VATGEFATPLHFLLVVFVIVSAHDRRARSMSMGHGSESRIVICVGSSRSVLECGSPLPLWDHGRNSAFPFSPPKAFETPPRFDAVTSFLRNLL